MISQFPEFSRLRQEDVVDIASFAKQFPPFSDFNVTSMWTWDTQQSIHVSWHNENLVVQFADYMTGLPFFSVLGKHDMDATIRDVMTYAREHDIPHELRLVPECVIPFIQETEGLAISEDEDSHDYILSAEALSTFGGNKFRGKKNFLHRFQKEYGNRVEVLIVDLTDSHIQNQITSVFDQWGKQSSDTPEDIAMEQHAIARMLAHAGEFPVYGLGVFIDAVLVAFSIDEILHDGYGMIHYEKADKSYTGIFPFLKQQSAKEFLARGSQYINYEQDLGIEGLRTAKRSYRPITYLKKYTIGLV